ncbi:hypothetical protein MASR1M101_38400 [Gemmatimonas sp.]
MGNRCQSYWQRTLWDGDQLLYEWRTPDGTSTGMNSGYAGYVHVEGLDQPLGLIRSDGTRVLNYHWRGLGESSVFTNGAAGDASITSGLPAVDWPTRTQGAVYFTPNVLASGPSGPFTWFGTLAENGACSTGLLYKRNRYFDPASGRFTQADPIGLGGGLNLYGFAGGDPVNFSDPFGLCPQFITGQPCSTAVTIGVGFVPVLCDAIDIAGAAIGRDLMTGEDISGVRVGVTIAGTLFGSGKLAREGAKHAAPALGKINVALAEVHEAVGKLSKGAPGKFGSPQRGTSKKGYRLDPPHPNAKPGTPEEGWHINWWDWTQGKRGSGGRSGAVPINPP